MNNNYKLYIESVFNLAETISVKFEDVATAVNQAVLMNYGYDSVSEDKYTWKYYQNISGVYHFSDKPMYISSLDVLDENGNPEQIILNKENLLNHPATRKAYLFGKRHYYSLLQLYPEQSTLILGILYPCDITIAIEAKEGTILSYPSYLVEFNEYNFISKLQLWIYNYLTRWVNRQYVLSDDLYLATYLGQFFINIIPVIINIRLQACNTNEAHSFHVRQYLASHGMLDVYLDVMTKKQSLFFYRNILYIQRNSGTQDTFDWLVENLMTNRTLPLFDYTMKHDVTNMLLSEMNNELNYHPEVIFKKNPINFPGDTRDSSTYSLSKVMSKLNYITDGNLIYHDTYGTAIRETLEDSKSNVVGTKLLESSVTDYNEAVPYTISDILLNHWLHQISDNTYNAYLPLFIPKSKKTVNLSVKDAFVLFIYAAYKTIGVTLITMPKVLAWRVLRHPLPSLVELRSIASYEYVTDAEINEVYNTVPVIQPVESIDAFYKQCISIYNSTIQQYAIQCSKQNYNTRGEIKAVISKMYSDVRIDLNKDGLTYGEWFSINDINLDDFTNTDFLALSLSVIGEATGSSSNKSISIKQTQRAMVEMLTLLSSYTIQILSDITEPPVQLVPTSSVELGDVNAIEKTHDYVTDVSMDVNSSNSKEKDILHGTLKEFENTKVFGEKEKSIVKLNFGINFTNYNGIHSFDPTEVKLPNLKILDIVTNANETARFIAVPKWSSGVDFNLRQYSILNPDEVTHKVVIDPVATDTTDVYVNAIITEGQIKNEVISWSLEWTPVKVSGASPVLTMMSATEALIQFAHREEGIVTYGPEEGTLILHVMIDGVITGTPLIMHVPSNLYKTDFISQPITIPLTLQGDGNSIRSNKVTEVPLVASTLSTTVTSNKITQVNASLNSNIQTTLQQDNVTMIPLNIVGAP